MPKPAKKTKAAKEARVYIKIFLPKELRTAFKARTVACDRTMNDVILAYITALMEDRAQMYDLPEEEN